MTTLVDLEVAIDRKPRDPLRPAAELPHAGTMAFLPDGNLLVLHRPGGSSGVVVREHAPTADGAWSESRTAPLKGVRGSPFGCAVRADGARLAAGHKKARLYDWPGVAPRNRTVTVCDTSTGAKLASIKTDEWSFAWAAMPDESTVLTVGLALDWVSGDEETDGQRVLGCYDADTGRARWRRVLRADQIPGLDLAAGRLWVAGDEAPYATKHLLALSIADGAVLRTIGLAERWRPGAAAPVAVAPSTLALAVSSYKYNAHRYVAVDVERAVVVADLGHGGDAVGAEFPTAARAGTRRVAAEVDGTTVVWQLP